MNRFRFSLRTLFVVVTVACVWLGYQLNWIRQRHEILRKNDQLGGWTGSWPNPKPSWRLHLLREQPVGYIMVGNGVEESEFRRIASLFPEAEVVRTANENSAKIHIAPLLP